MRAAIAFFLALSLGSCGSKISKDVDPVVVEDLVNIVNSDTKGELVPFSSLEPAYQLEPADDGFYYHTNTLDRIGDKIIFFLDTSFYLNGQEVYTVVDFLSESTLARNHHYPVEDFLFPKPVDKYDEVRLKINVNGIETVNVGLNYKTHQDLLGQGKTDRFFVIRDVEAPPMIHVVRP